MLRRGDHDAAVADLRAALASFGLLPVDLASRAVADAENDRDGDESATAAWYFDDNVDAAVRAFQQQRGLITDGCVGAVTERELIAARWTLGDRTLSYTLSAPMTGDDVSTLQTRLAELGYDAGRADGVFTGRLDAAVREFQRHRGIPDDGVFGPVTLRELQRIAPMATGGRPQYLREVAALHQAGPWLGGKRIVIDPAHGGEDHGWQVGEVRAGDLAFDLAGRLSARVTATGMQAFITRGPDANPTQAERAKLANEVAADLFVSLHVDGSTCQHAAGIATFHFGTDTGNNSSVGEALASLIQRELVARTGMIDCRVHHRPWEILRRTQMPAVQVEIGYLTNPADRARLVDESFRDQIADGLLVAVKRLYLDGRDDRPTGTFSFHDLLEYERSVQG